LSLEGSQIWIIVAIVVLAVIGFAVFRLRKGKVSGETGKQFLVMGIIWILFGIGYSIWRSENPFDVTIFTFGLVFTVAGGFQLLLEKYRKRGDK
jgi:hypothetical protein